MKDSELWKRDQKEFGREINTDDNGRDVDDQDDWHAGPYYDKPYSREEVEKL